MKTIVKILLSISIAVGICASAYARPVKGVVRCGKEKLANVVVSDGTSFAQTDKKGSYTLDVDDNADLIFVITPSGYVAPFESGTPIFYKKLSEVKTKCDFELQKWGNTNNYTFIAIADPQPKTQNQFEQYSDKIFPDIKETAEKYKQNGIAIYLGDIVWDAPDLYPQMKKLDATLPMPIYPVIGNHDHDMRIEGDNYKAEQNYRNYFGPNYYAFAIGKDYVIVLDNIIYNTRTNYTEAIDEKQLEWVRNYLQYVPQNSRLFIAMHAPLFKWWKKGDNNKLDGGEELFEICKNYKLNVITGHSHRNHNLQVQPNVFEHNAGTTNGALWKGDYNTDGSPRGYKIFENNGAKLTWYYKTVGKPANYQIKIYNRGMSKYNPNQVVAAIWDWDKEWTVEWYEDGKAMGAPQQVYDDAPDYFLEMKNKKKIYESKSDARSYWYFAASPSDNAKQVKFVATNEFGQTFADSITLGYRVDVQAHRGGAGLMPENTVEAMINAINYGVNTLECDMNITADKKVVISHDPWMNYKFVTSPDGTEITKQNQKSFALYKMTYDSIATYETGLKENPDFPQQKKMKTHKPLAGTLIDACERYCEKNKIEPLRYNIEIKSRADRDNIFSPAYTEFCDLAMDVLMSKNLGSRLTVQSFDARALNYVHQKYPTLTLSYNVEKKDNDFEKNMSQLNFVPKYYSPNFSVVDENLVEKCHKLGMKIVVWTVDKPEDIQRMLDLKVDAIISNYPDRVLEITRGY